MSVLAACRATTNLALRMFAAVEASRILVVEDSAELVSLLERVLGEQGYDVSAATDGETGLARAIDQAPDLVILDLGLPGRDGLQVASELRRRGVNAPVLMLTARGAVADRVSGLEAGADDYLAKAVRRRRAAGARARAATSLGIANARCSAPGCATSSSIR